MKMPVWFRLRFCIHYYATLIICPSDVTKSQRIELLKVCAKCGKAKRLWGTYAAILVIQRTDSVANVEDKKQTQELGGYM